MTTQYLIDAVLTGIVVTLGLFVLWSFVGGMRRAQPSVRLAWAIMAGLVSFAATLAVPIIV